MSKNEILKIETMNDAIYYIYKKFIDNSITYDDLEISMTKTHGQGGASDICRILIQAFLNKLDDAYALTLGLIMFSNNQNEKVEKLDEIHKRIELLKNKNLRTKNEVEESLKYYRITDKDILLVCFELYKNYIK